ncbi:hypothetical protein EST38_g7817 [Candolleomyces aberdarensis]|uniref:Uncharacterized protein n=1 Tax=Candolleomyces aberdarensis TaxID=2316362 RepID=A0A4Q2DGC5_9AGAR|nr:hypothetical protein EST38_g7817 [Candolleomyces aberdarensis]
MDYYTLSRAQKVLQKPRLAKSSFDKFSIKVLRALCENHAINVAGTGQHHRKLKADYINALLTSRGIRVNSQQAPPLDQGDWVAGMTSLSALLPTRAPGLIFGVNDLAGEEQPLRVDGTVQRPTSFKDVHMMEKREGPFISTSRVENDNFMLMEEDEEDIVNATGTAHSETDVLMPIEEEQPERNATYPETEDVEMTPVKRRSPKTIGVRLLETPKSWHLVKEIRFACNDDGGINLDKLAVELGSPDRAIQVG